MDRRFSLLGVLFFLYLSACSSNNEIQVKEGFVEINGSEVYYKTMGEGEPLIIVHGGPVMDHSYFLPHIEGLAKKYQLVFYDQRACGRSSVKIDSTTMTLNGFVDDIELLRRELGFNKINLMGHSWGGLLAMKYGIAYGENLNHLILTNSMAPSVNNWQKEGVAVSERATDLDRRDRQKIMESGALQSAEPARAIERLLKISFRPQMYDTTYLNQLNLYIPDDYMVRSGLFGLLGTDMRTFDLYKDLSKITCPTLIVYGGEEPAATMHANKMTKSFDNAHLNIIENSGHFPFIEQKNEFLRVVELFLN